ncbi:alpha/beta fold hydrolase [Streptomyces umbrinus]
MFSLLPFRTQVFGPAAEDGAGGGDQRGGAEGTAGFDVVAGADRVAGDRDPQLKAIQDTADHISGATCVELPGCGHFETFLRIDLTLPVIRPFLARCAAG